MPHLLATYGQVLAVAAPIQIMPHFSATPEQILALIVLVPALYLGAVALGRTLKRRAGVQLGVSYQLLGLALAIYLPLRLTGLDWGPPNFDLWRELDAVAVLTGVLFGIALLRRYLWEYYFAERRGIAIPKFLQQVLSVFLFCIAALGVVYGIYGIPITGVQLTSTVLVGVIGWAMQDLLGNVISGVSLQVGKPFKAGDWLILENYHAEVIEVNWRSTRLRTTDDHYLDVPNTSIVRSTIVNLSYPSHLHAMRIRIGLAYDAPPNQVKAILLQAAAEATGVLRSPEPKVFLVDFADSSVTYEIKYWINNHASYNEVSDALRTNAWYSLKRAGLAIPFPIRTVQLERKRAAQYDVPEATRTLIRHKPFFQCLSDEQASRIVGSACLLLFGRGERIVEQGMEGDSMFVLVRGAAEVHVRQAGSTGETAAVATLQAGDYFGEMSLLTGEKRSATVLAMGDCEVLEIAKPHLASLLQENAQLMQNLSEMLARRRMANEGTLATVAGKHAIVEKEKEYADRFLARLASFFEL